MERAATIEADEARRETERQAETDRLSKPKSIGKGLNGGG